MPVERRGETGAVVVDPPPGAQPAKQIPREQQGAPPPAKAASRDQQGTPPPAKAASREQSAPPVKAASREQQGAPPPVKVAATTTTTLLRRDEPVDELEDDIDEPVVERAPRRKRRRSWRPTAVALAYQRLGTSLALIAALAVAGVLWFVGGNYTLLLVGSWDKALASTIESAGRSAWVIPVGISVIEIFLYPQPERSIVLTIIRASLWLGILVFDVYATYQGFTPWVISKGLTNPILSQIAGVVFGFVCAFVPERILRWVVVELYEMWLEPLFKRLGVRLVPVG